MSKVLRSVFVVWGAAAAALAAWFADGDVVGFVVLFPLFAIVVGGAVLLLAGAGVGVWMVASMLSEATSSDDEERR